MNIINGKVNNNYTTGCPIKFRESGNVCIPCS